jgi:hypothetical protein
VAERADAVGNVGGAGTTFIVKQAQGAATAKLDAPSRDKNSSPDSTALSPFTIHHSLPRFFAADGEWRASSG